MVVKPVTNTVQLANPVPLGNTGYSIYTATLESEVSMYRHTFELVASNGTHTTTIHDDIDINPCPGQ
jgi:hypothetical protein